MISLFQNIFCSLTEYTCQDKLRQELMDSIITSACGSVSAALIEFTESATQAGKIASEAVKTMEEGFAKKQAYMAALKAAEEAMKVGGDDAVTAAGQLAVQAVKQSSDDVAMAAAKVAASEAAANAARIAGAVTVGLGAVFAAWDIYNIVKDCQKKSLGDSLREIAEELEESAIERN